MKTIRKPRAISSPPKPVNESSSHLALTINQTQYNVVAIPAVQHWIKRAYRLVKPDGTVYDLAETRYGPECDCPDYIFRRDGLDLSGCKHVKALVRHGLISGR